MMSSGEFERRREVEAMAKEIREDFLAALDAVFSDPEHMKAVYFLQTKEQAKKRPAT